MNYAFINIISGILLYYLNTIPTTLNDGLYANMTASPSFTLLSLISIIAKVSAVAQIILGLVLIIRPSLLNASKTKKYTLVMSVIGVVAFLLYWFITYISFIDTFYNL